MVTAIAAVASGLAIGLILGLVGGGGSILAVPLLVHVVGIDSPHLAIGTAAAAVAANAAAGLVRGRAGTTIGGWSGTSARTDTSFARSR